MSQVQFVNKKTIVQNDLLRVEWDVKPLNVLSLSVVLSNTFHTITKQTNDHSHLQCKSSYHHGTQYH